MSNTLSPPTTPPPSAKSNELSRIEDAFALFNNQSVALQTTFDRLQKELAQANKDLNAKNIALSQKVDELQQLTSRLHCILESLTDGVLIVGETLTVEHCNPAAARLLNKPREEIEGRPYAEVTSDLSNVEAIRRAIRDGMMLQDEKRRCADTHGGWVEVLAGVAPILSPEQKILGAVEVLRDVTQLHALEVQVHHQERMAALGEMAASVAHEIRNPLGTIEGFARLLRRDLEDQPQHRRLADKIVEGAQNLNYVITNLLTYVRPMTLQHDTFEAGKLLASVAEGLTVSATARRVQVEMTTPSPEIRLNADIRQIRQVLLNIGLNAVEACEADGHVTISASRSGREVKFKITDTGSGMDAETLTKIFDPFFTTKQAGTGLGLSLCHKIVVAHNGRIDVDSKPGQGTVMEIILPDYGDKA